MAVSGQCRDSAGAHELTVFLKCTFCFPRVQQINGTGEQSHYSNRARDPGLGLTLFSLLVSDSKPIGENGKMPIDFSGLWIGPFFKN